MMKKTVVLFFALLCAVMTQAANYGILVNGKVYFAADYKGKDANTGQFDEYLAHVSVKAGDYCQLYDAENKAAWVVPLDEYTVKGFALSGDKYNVTVTGCYDFYIKLQYQNDQLYIGEGSNCGSGQDISGGGSVTPGYSGSAPANCPDVLLQAFYWDSYTDQGHGRTKWIDFINKNGQADAEEIGQWFDLVWLPPMSKASGGTGYHPSDYSNLESDWGTEKRLRELIEKLHKNGARVVADIVINHADPLEGWCGYPTYKFGAYGNYTPDGSYICNTDEVNYSDEAPSSCKGFATGNADDGYGSEANYPSSRDWDHTNVKVREMFKAYLKWLRNDVKVDGFRYDYCKGYHNSHINEYNTAAQAYFSVMEMWDGDVNALMSHLNDAGYNTLTFDFATKYQAFNNGIASDNYGALKGAGLPGAGKARYAVTFLDSHDSYQRDDNEFCGSGNSMTVCKDKILQCYAYLLSMPGVPLVFYPHWATFKDPIKQMINARYKTGVHSESRVEDEAANNYYKATIYGTNGEIRLLVGPGSGYNSTPTGYTLASKGVNYGVYYKMTTTRGDKNTEREDRTQGVDETHAQNALRGDKFIQNGKLYIRCGEQVFDVMGRPVQ